MSRSPARTILFAAALLGACGEIGVAEDSAASQAGPAPLPAPRVYRSVDKNLTFPTPEGSFYCPLPADWVGSDHGTVLFLTSPRRCSSGSGYASSGRGALNAPNIQVYYGYDVIDEEGEAPSEPCEVIGRAAFFGAERPLCAKRHDPEIVEVTATAPYMAEGAEADIRSEAVFTLVTHQARLESDLAIFKALLGRVGTCDRVDANGGRPYASDRPACPTEAVWF